MSHTCRFFTSEFRSSLSHTSSMQFKSTNCPGQVISWRMCYSLHSNYLSRILLVCFGSLSWVTVPVPLVTAWCCSIGIARPIQFASHLVQIPNLAFFKTTKTIAESPVCFTVGMIHGVAAISSTLIYTLTLLFDPNISNWFVSPKDSNSLLYSPVSAHLY